MRPTRSADACACMKFSPTLQRARVGNGVDSPVLESTRTFVSLLQSPEGEAFDVQARERLARDDVHSLRRLCDEPGDGPKSTFL